MNKRGILFVLLLVSSMFVVVLAEEDSNLSTQPSTIGECGFLCKVNEFFFGSSEVRNAAGSAWFDRNENIVGFAGNGYRIIPVTPTVVTPPPTIQSQLEQTKREIDAGLACFSTGNCPSGVDELTHAEAHEKYKELAKKGKEILDAHKTAVAAAETTYQDTIKDDCDDACKTKAKKTLDEAKKCDGGCKAAQDAKDAADRTEWQGSWLEGMGGAAYGGLTAGQWGSNCNNPNKCKEGTWGARDVMTGISQGIGGVATLAQKLGSYQALSNLLVPDATQEWMDAANNKFMNTWADLSGHVAREVCEVDEKSRYEEPGKSHVFVHTAGGTYQFVGSIQAEKTNSPTPIMCERKIVDDEEVLACVDNQVCVEGFCYKDEGEDGKPDEETPLKGKFYKITWGVSAPQDEKQTPYIDENGYGVKFNIQLQGATSKWVFTRQGAYGESVVMLENGARDGGTIAKFLNEDYSRVCIKFHPEHRVIDDEEEPVKEICTNFIDSNRGVAEYGKSSSPSVTTQSADVGMNI